MHFYSINSVFYLPQNPPNLIDFRFNAILEMMKNGTWKWN